ncbi:sugar nucleotide-binding protein [Chloroflexota bacterium]
MAIRVIILGGSGMLGHKLWQAFSDRFDTYITLRSVIDSYTQYRLYDPKRAVDCVSVEDFDSISQAIAAVRPDVTVNCIGIVKQGVAAGDPIANISIDTIIPHLLVELYRAADSRLIHISTDCLFSGRR